MSTVSNSESKSFRGSMKAGFFTAQLGVELTVTGRTLTLSAVGRTFQIDREHFQGLENTSILGLFKRGIRIRHEQHGLPNNIVFYPRIGQAALRQELASIGWS